MLNTKFESQNIFIQPIDHLYSTSKEIDEYDYSFDNKNIKEFDDSLNTTRKSIADNEKNQRKLSPSQSTEDILSDIDNYDNPNNALVLTKILLVDDWKEKIKEIKRVNKLFMSNLIKQEKNHKCYRRLTFDNCYNYNGLSQFSPHPDTGYYK